MLRLAPLYDIITGSFNGGAKIMSHRRAKTIRRLARSILGLVPAGDNDDYYQTILRHQRGTEETRVQVVLAAGSFRAVTQKIKRVSKATHHSPLLAIAAWAVVQAQGLTNQQLREAA